MDSLLQGECQKILASGRALTILISTCALPTGFLTIFTPDTKMLSVINDELLHLFYNPKFGDRLPAGLRAPLC